MTRLLIVISVTVSLAASGCGGASKSATQNNPRLAAALAFARCMRAHGIPHWPDPDATGGFDKLKLRQLGVPFPRIRSIEDAHCNIAIPGDSRQQAHITAADRSDYLRAAACMRSHGFPEFPDPTFPNNGITVDIPRSVDQHSPRFRTAAETCTRLIPAGLPYSHSRGS